jgi:riboflavin kinase / FMN adenylyltransferase
MLRLGLNNTFSECETTTKSVVTIGSFDGLHLGHQELFKQMEAIAVKYNYRTIVITFEPLPLEYFLQKENKARLPRLSMLRDKVRILKKLGYIDEVVVIHFNALVAALTADDFIQKILKQKLNTCHAVVGYDFKFGKDGRGTAVDLINNGINVTNIGSYQIKDTLVSSSRLRELALNNQLAKIKAYLGRNLQYTARVIYGKQLGQKYKVPTLNLSLGRNKLALHGIYVAWVYLQETRYNAVVSIGTNPSTSDDEDYHLEAHLLDKTVNAYGMIATVEILMFLRAEKKFMDLTSLFQQIKLDIEEAKQYFQTN